MTFSQVFRINSTSLKSALIFVCVVASSRQTLGHDTWVETNTPLVHVNDAVYIDLCLGNHGNQHRDFKLAGKIDLKDCTLDVISPKGVKTDLLPGVIDMGLSPKEGYWKAKYVAADSGLFVISHTCEKIVNHGQPLRTVKSGKAYFGARQSSSELPQQGDYSKPLGHVLEILPLTDPIVSIGPRKEMAIQVLLKGNPLPNARVTFVPRREELREGFDDRFERRTNDEGKAFFTPMGGDQILIVTRVNNGEEKGQGYDGTNYSATLTISVPETSR